MVISRAQGGMQVRSAPSSPAKFSKVMREWKDGKLKSSSGSKVTSKKQAMAIAVKESSKVAGKNKRTVRLKRKKGRRYA
mgnify:CR=1 FL=1